MTITQYSSGESSNRVKGGKRGRQPGTKYTRHSKQLIEALEKVYAECPNPDFYYREKIRREQTILEGMNDNQLKVWFQNRRCRDRKKANDKLMVGSEHVTTTSNLLRDENEKSTTSGAGTGSGYATRNTNMNLTTEASSAQASLMIANDGLLLLAEETRNEFLSKANGTAINWSRILTLKLPSPVSAGAIYVSENCSGMAARACTVIPLEPIKIIEILKDQPSWLRSCRNMDVFAMYSAHNGGTIELIYKQYDAPTTMTCARDFWTLRYTSVLDDGSFVVCEKSISGSDAILSSPVALEFVRGRMLASGYLIRPCDGGSTVDLVDHVDLEASSVPKVIRSLYESSELVAKKMIIPALNYISCTVSETNDKRTHLFCQESSLRSFGQKLSRGFNDIINGFTEDGWTLMNADSPDDILISVRRTNNCEVVARHDNVICAKASLLLKKVFPAKLLKLLKEQRSSWMNFNFSNHSGASRAAFFPFPGSTTHELSETAVLLGHTEHEDEVLEVVRFRCITSNQLMSSSNDLYHVQISNGLGEDTGVGACSELIFAPIHRTMPNNAVLLSSGFRILSLGSNTGDGKETWLSADSTLNKESEFDNVKSPCSVLVLAFQFPLETHRQQSVTLMAQKYIQHVISSVKNLCPEIMPDLRPTITRNSIYVPPGSNRSANYSENLAIGLDTTGMESTQADLAMGPTITLNSAYVPPGSNTAAMGLSMTLDSNYATMNSTEANPSVGPKISQEWTCARSGSNLATNFTDANPAAGLEVALNSAYATMDSLITRDWTCALSGANSAMNSTETDPVVGTMSTRDRTFVPLESNPATNSTNANPTHGLAMILQPTYDTMSSNGADAEMELEITADPTYVPIGSNPVIYSTVANPDIGLAVTLDSVFEPSGSISSTNSTDLDPALGLLMSRESNYAPTGSNHAMNLTYPTKGSTEAGPAMGTAFALDSSYAPSGSNLEMNYTNTNPAMGLATTPGTAYATVNSTHANPTMRQRIAPGSAYDANLAKLICQSYRSNLGVEMLGVSCQNNDTLLELVQNHQHAILCFTFTATPSFLYANQAALNMLETTMQNLLFSPVDKILGNPNSASLATALPTTMKQGYAILPPGYCLSEMKHCVSYKHGVMWKVAGSDGSVQCLALAVADWSFVSS